MTLNGAIIGTGFISNKVIDGISQSEASQVRVIVGRRPEVLAEFQNAHAIAQISTNYDAVLADPAIDAVYIGLPNHLHHSATIAAARAGKAVLSEKSLTTTMGEADALMAAVTDNNTFFVEGFMYLAHPFLKRFQEVLKDGRWEAYARFPVSTRLTFGKWLIPKAWEHCTTWGAIRRHCCISLCKLCVATRLFPNGTCKEWET